MKKEIDLESFGSVPVHYRSKEHNSRIKHEQDSEGAAEIIVLDVRDEKIVALEQEKQKIILETVAIKRENQKNYFQWQKTEAALRTATMERDLDKNEMKELRQNNAILGTKLKEQQLEMERALELTAKDKETISNLNAEKKRYLAKINQLQRGLEEVLSESDAGNDSTIHKLDKILSHKKK